MSIQNKFKDNYAGQEITNRGFSKLKGSVIGSDPLTCTCVVIYTNQNGQRETESSMPVQTNSPDDWFPKAGDSVIIEAYGSRPVITGRWIADYGSQIYAESELKSDIFPDENDQDNGGSIA